MLGVWNPGFSLGGVGVNKACFLQHIITKSLGWGQQGPLSASHINTKTLATTLCAHPAYGDGGARMMGLFVWVSCCRVYDSLTVPFLSETQDTKRFPARSARSARHRGLRALIFGARRRRYKSQSSKTCAKGLRIVHPQGLHRVWHGGRNRHVYTGTRTAGRSC